MPIVKRDGRIVDFDKTRISSAILKAMLAVDTTLSDEDKQTAADIASRIAQSVGDQTTKVEDIQDLVEEELMLSKRTDVAKAYILYRHERTKNRESNTGIVQKIMARAKSKVDMRSNANVDEKSFSGREKESATEVGKSIALEFGGLSEEIAQAHKDMLVYQHDLEKAIYGVHNCLNLDFPKIFERGFRTRNGDVRPPTSFSTACQLVAVAFQCQSQVQFGGVGSIHLDYDLAPFVKKSFYKHYADGMKYIGNFNNSQIGSVINHAETKKLSVDDEFFKSDAPVYRYALDMLEKEGSQAAQALYHNLNTLESRQGAQVPFTSINFGRDTSTEGRMVSRWMLEASIDGIGKHHLTSIFPISIFQYKKNVNGAKDSPNYDLKQLALKSMSKRIYPNWCNGDWSQANEDEENPDTFFSTMGKCKLQLI